MGTETGFDLIFSYTRAQAIADGVLVDVSVLAKEAGYCWPVALTSTVYHEYVVPPSFMLDYGQSEAGRLWDLLAVLHHAFQKSNETSRLAFSVLFAMQEAAKPILVDLIAVCGPGDDGNPVLTIMLPGED